MKKVIMTLLALVFLVPVASGNAGILFEDDFEDNNRDGWTHILSDEGPAAGQWIVVNEPSKGYVLEGTASSIPQYLKLDLPDLPDRFILEFEAKTVLDGGTSASLFGFYVPWLGWGDGYIGVHRYRPTDTRSFMINQFGVSCVQGITNAQDTSITPFDWHSFKFVKDEDWYTFYYDDNVVFQGWVSTSSSCTNLGGSLVLATSRSNITRYDNIRISTPVPVPPPNILVGVDRIENELVDLDIMTGEGTVIGSTAIPHVPEDFGLALESLAYDPLLEVFYAVDNNQVDGSMHLLKYDPETWDGEVIGALGTSLRVLGLAFDPVNRILYGVEASGNPFNDLPNLISIDVNTGSMTHLGDLDIPRNNPFFGLAYSVSGDVLYASDESSVPNGSSIYEIDPSNANVSLIGAIGFPGQMITGLSYDNDSEVLYGSSDTYLFSIDTQTGAGTIIGAHNQTEITGLALASPIPEPSSIYSDTILGDNPFAYYRLGESAVTYPVIDEMGTHHGSCQNSPAVGATGALLSDPTNTAMCFDSSQSQYIELTTLGDYGSGMTEGFTVEYWLKSTDPSPVQSFLGSIRKKDIPTDPYFRSNFFIAVEPIDSVRLYFRDDIWNRYNVESHPEDRTVDIFDGQWHHMVHVYDTTGTLPEDRMLLYVDGKRQEVVVWRGGGIPSDFSNFNVPMILAAQNFRGDIRGHLNGCLDEVAFYLRPLIEEEVLSHYQAAISAYITVDIDVKPGDDSNSINCNNEKGVIAVAILTTDDFDASTVDHSTVIFEGGASETHVDKKTGVPRRHEEDVDYDGDTDLVFHFRLGDTGLICDSTQGTLIGETFDGMPIAGTDSISIVGKPENYEIQAVVYTDEEGKSWIDITLVDEDGNPVPYENFQLTLPDGTVVEGELDSNGSARSEITGTGPGDYQISFPDLDTDEWVKI